MFDASANPLDFFFSPPPPYLSLSPCRLSDSILERSIYMCALAVNTNEAQSRTLSRTRKERERNSNPIFVHTRKSLFNDDNKSGIFETFDIYIYILLLQFSTHSSLTLKISITISYTTLLKYVIIIYYLIIIFNI